MILNKKLKIDISNEAYKYISKISNYLYSVYPEFKKLVFGIDNLSINNIKCKINPYVLKMDKINSPLIDINISNKIIKENDVMNKKLFIKYDFYFKNIYDDNLKLSMGTYSIMDTVIDKYDVLLIGICNILAKDILKNNNISDISKTPLSIPDDLIYMKTDKDDFQKYKISENHNLYDDIVKNAIDQYNNVNIYFDMNESMYV